MYMYNKVKIYTCIKISIQNASNRNDWIITEIINNPQSQALELGRSGVAGFDNHRLILLKSHVFGIGIGKIW